MGVAEATFDFRFRSRWLLALVPHFGGARFSLRSLLAAAGCAEDRTGLVLGRLSGDCLLEHHMSMLG